MKIDWKLKGNNLFKFNCNKESIIHPETCSQMIKMDHSDDLSLFNWITSNNVKEIKASLSDWLTAYYNQIVLPQASSSTLGCIKVGNSLDINSSTGVLNINKANSSVLGGVKTGYTRSSTSDTNYPISVDSYGIAYADLSALSTSSSLLDWSGLSLNKTARIYTNNDVFSNLDLNNYINTFNTYFNSITSFNPNRTYPIRIDNNGRLYTFVNWIDTTYSSFVGSNSGLVPSASSVTSPNSKYLNANGEWTIPTNTIYTTFNTTDAGLVPAASTQGATTKFLKGDGSWATPTYNLFSSSVNGLVPASDGTGETSMYLKGDGTWATPTSSSKILTYTRYSDLSTNVIDTIASDNINTEDITIIINNYILETTAIQDTVLHYLQRIKNNNNFTLGTRKVTFLISTQQNVNLNINFSSYSALSNINIFSSSSSCTYSNNMITIANANKALYNKIEGIISKSGNPVENYINMIITCNQILND